MHDNKQELYKCDCTAIHENIVDKVRESMPQEENLYDLA